MIEKTVVLIKHDGIQRNLVGETIKRFEQTGLKMVALKLIQPTEEIADNHYKLTPEWIEKLGNNTRKSLESRGQKVTETNEEIAKRVHSWLKGYLMEGPIIAIIFEGYHAIDIGRKIIGIAESRSAPLGTIRGDFSTESYELADSLKRPLRSMVHASGNKQEADNEIKTWFSKSEICSYHKKEWDVMH